MCFDLDSQPPDLPVTLAEEGASISFTEDITLTSADGTKFAAYVARPDAPNGAGIVILPDVRGLYQFYKDLANRFAVAGVEAIVIDYFGRTAGVATRGDDFNYMPYVQQTKPEQITQDVAAAIAYLRQLPGVGLDAIFTVGFCFGGSSSFLQATAKHGLAGVIGFYGRPGTGINGAPGPITRVREFECPVLGFFGGADQSIPAEAVQQFDTALSEAGIEHEIITYPGAPHSFFDKKHAEFQEEAADSWQRMLTFIGAHTPKS